MSNGRRQPSRGGTSRMTRECQVRICERLGVKFPGPTRQTLPSRDFCGTAALPLKPDIARRGWHGRKVPTEDISSTSALKLMRAPIETARIPKVYCSFSHTRCAITILSGPFGLGSEVGALVMSNLFPSTRQKRTCSVPTHPGFQATSTCVMNFSPSTRHFPV